MRTRGRLLDVLDKAENGPIVEEQEWDVEYIQKPIARLVEKYDVKWEKEAFVPSDDALADRVFAAGLEFCPAPTDPHCGQCLISQLGRSSPFVLPRTQPKGLLFDLVHEGKAGNQCTTGLDQF